MMVEVWRSWDMMVEVWRSWADGGGVEVLG